MLRRIPYLSLLAFVASIGVLLWVLNRPSPTPVERATDIKPAVRDTSGTRIRLSERDQRQLALPDGAVHISSLLRIPERMHYGQFHWSEDNVPEGKAWVLVDLDKQTMSVFRGDHEIGTGVVLYGVDSHPTPRGRFPVLAKLKDHQSSIYDAEMPYTLRLTGDGVAIHGSNVRKGLATHGCIGIPLAFAARLFDAVEVGDPVYIVNSVSRLDAPAAQKKGS